MVPCASRSEPGQCLAGACGAVPLDLLARVFSGSEVYVTGGGRKQAGSVCPASRVPHPNAGEAPSGVLASTRPTSQGR